MISVAQGNSWRTIGASVVGSRHIRIGQPNQDALMLGELPEGLGAFAAISDGHGSRTCFRSAEGARQAVMITDELMRTKRIVNLLTAHDGMRLLAQEILRHWRSSVMNHLKMHPFTHEETDTLDRQQRALLGRNALMAYGATLLVACAMETEVFFLQLGDGDFLTLDGTGSISGVFGPDGKHMGNATTSLCLPNALEEFRFYRWRTGLPRMLLGSTDGYGNSFRTEADFHKALRDYARLVSEHGGEAVSAKLPEWLRETSEKGSGDDISVALLFRD